MEKCLGTTLIVQLRPGAGAALGMGMVATAEPDGYTIGSLTMPNLVSQAIATQAPFTIDSFDYIGNIIGSQSTLAVSVNSPFKTLKEFVDFGLSSRVPVNVAVAGIGNDDHLTGLRFAKMSNVKMNFIPFGDGSLARNALLGGHADVAIMNNTLVAEFSNEIRALAVAGTERSPSLPNSPTFKEVGYDLVGGSNHLLGAPKGVPAEVLTKWRDCVQTVGNDAEFIAEAKRRFAPLDIKDAKATEAFVREQDAILRQIWADDPWIKK
jgi:tripartite-type tricarboxylate transporter receptor subunit TctC